MGHAKKFQNNYPKESVTKKQDIESQKKEIKIYISKINELLKDSDGQKKAAEIISQLINSK